LTVVIKDTLQDALTELFGDSPPTRETSTDEPTEQPNTPNTPNDSEAEQLLQDIDDAYAAYDDAIEAGDLVEAATQLELAKEKYEAYRDLLAEADDEGSDGEGGGGGTGSTGTTSTTTPRTSTTPTTEEGEA
jgi:hypothetical protein